MVVKSQIKLIKSLHQKKYRKEHGLFLIEGKKGINEALANGLEPYLLCSNISEMKTTFAYEKVSKLELEQMSALKNPNGYVGIFKIPKTKSLDFSNWILVLDGVQDPGNLGTIIRLCDWFGISQILCSKDTVDCFSPKVVQASMGSITRVLVYYEDLEAVLSSCKKEIYGTFMEGNAISKIDFSIPGIIVLGNEGQGISKDISNLVSKKISIPSFGNSEAESLNVASAAAVLMYEMRRVRP